MSLTEDSREQLQFHHKKLDITVKYELLYHSLGNIKVIQNTTGNNLHLLLSMQSNLRTWLN